MMTATVVGERIVFEGGRFGPHSLDIESSTAERVLAHWAGYLAANPPRTIHAGSKVTFNRGTKVPPVGRVLRVYRSRETRYRLGGRMMAVVHFKMVNGRYTTYRLPVSALTLLPEEA